MDEASSIENENRAVLVVLNQADQFYREQQRLAKLMRKGFLDLAKARSTVGAPISALDCREELQAQFTLASDDVGSVSIGNLEAADAWRKNVGAVGAGPEQQQQAQSADKLRRRGMESQELLSVSNEEQIEQTDTVLLFTALAPPTLRKAKREFVNALSSALKLANSIQRMQVAQAKLAASSSEERFAI